MDRRMRALRAAFPHTLPVLAGYLFLGAAYGIYMNKSGFAAWYPPLISLTVFAGSMQFVLVNLLLSAFNPLQAALLTLMVNARHLFYGLSMLDRYRDAGRLKGYLIFALTDETFSVSVSAQPPEGGDGPLFMFFISLLNHAYWVAGSALGAALGELIAFNTQGIDFVMTALFIVIFLEQWLTHRPRLSAGVGVAVSACFLAILGPDNFIIPSMAGIVALLTLLRGRIEKLERAQNAQKEGERAA